ncbi:MAG: NAD(P)H-dependent glycerol-3-phosphate dehydrogenase [Geminicoccaceae bacterium]
MSSFETIGVLGAGAWGTALAVNAARAGLKVKLWGRDRSKLEAIRLAGSNLPYLPGVALDPAIELVADLDAASDVDALLVVVPAQTVGAVLKGLPVGDQPLVICAKGLERSSDRFLSEVVQHAIPRRPVAAMSGPNFALEVARGLPAAATLACPDESLGRRLAAAMSNEQFRLYWTDDLRGVELGGAVKNVLAIAAGIVAGRGLGENAKAALITRGLAELMRLGEALGARRETLMGLSGLGDLLLTAGSLTSRNMAFGHGIGEGADPLWLQQQTGKLVEGASTASAVVRLAARCPDIEVPICGSVAAILAGSLGIEQAIEALMTRPLRSEIEG